MESGRGGVEHCITSLTRGEVVLNSVAAAFAHERHVFCQGGATIGAQLFLGFKRS